MIEFYPHIRAEKVAEFLRNRSAMPGVQDLPQTHFPSYSEDAFGAYVSVTGQPLGWVPDEGMGSSQGWDIYDATTVEDFDYCSCSGSSVQGRRVDDTWTVYVDRASLGINTTKSVEKLIS